MGDFPSIAVSCSGGKWAGGTGPMKGGGNPEPTPPPTTDTETRMAHRGPSLLSPILAALWHLHPNLFFAFWWNHWLLHPLPQTNLDKWRPLSASQIAPPWSPTWSSWDSSAFPCWSAQMDIFHQAGPTDSLHPAERLNTGFYNESGWTACILFLVCWDKTGNNRKVVVK